MVGVVYGLVQANELGDREEEQGGLQLSATFVLGPTLDEVPDLMAIRSTTSVVDVFVRAVRSDSRCGP